MKTFLAVLLLLGGCAVAKPTVALVQFDAVELVMASPVRFVLFAESDAQARRAAREAINRMHRLDGVLSDYHPRSELNAWLNANGEARALSADLRNSIDKSLRLAEATRGAFDPTTGPLVALWREARASGVLPSAAQIAQAKARCGFRHVELTETGARLRNESMRLDFGAIGKGIALDEASEVLRSHGIERFLIDFDGEVAVGDAPPGRAAWQVQLASVNSDAPIKLQLTNAVVATSGASAQFVVIDRVTYSHVVDPVTGLGVQTSWQVSVIAKSAAEADALATAGCVLGPVELATILAKRFPNASAIVQSTNREAMFIGAPVAQPEQP